MGKEDRNGSPHSTSPAWKSLLRVHIWGVSCSKEAKAENTLELRLVDQESLRSVSFIEQCITSWIELLENRSIVSKLLK